MGMLIRVARHRGVMVLEERAKVRELEAALHAERRVNAALQQTVSALTEHVNTCRNLDEARVQQIRLLMDRCERALASAERWRGWARKLERALGKCSGIPTRRSRREGVEVVQ